MIAEQSRLHVEGDTPREAAAAPMRWLTASKNGDEIVALHEREQLPENPYSRSGVWCGFLALRFDAIDNGWLVLARKEQVETINWGGKPEKHYVSGPLGPARAARLLRRLEADRARHQRALGRQRSRLRAPAARRADPRQRGAAGRHLQGPRPSCWPCSATTCATRCSRSRWRPSCSSAACPTAATPARGWASASRPRAAALARLIGQVLDASRRKAAWACRWCRRRSTWRGCWKTQSTSRALPTRLAARAGRTQIAARAGRPRPHGAVGRQPREQCAPPRPARRGGCACGSSRPRRTWCSAWPTARRRSTPRWCPTCSAPSSSAACQRAQQGRTGPGAASRRPSCASPRQHRLCARRRLRGVHGAAAHPRPHPELFRARRRKTRFL